MKIDRLNVLQEMCDLCLQNREYESAIIQKNTNRIEEINIFFKSIRDNDSDYKFFSPRSEENIFKDKIKLYEDEKSTLEKENQVHYNKLSQFNKQLDQLKQLISDLKYGMPEDEKIDRKHLNVFDILDIQEKERQRISSELHDSSVQNLVYLIHMIELSSMYIDQDPIRAKLELETCINNLKSTIDGIREIIFNLRPMTFDDLGFRQCIENFITNIKSQFRDFEIDYNICELKNRSGENDRETDILMVTIYRIIQEAVTNVIKHSNGNKIILNVSEEDTNCLIYVKDNGKGFAIDDISEKKYNHFGISIMKERIDLLNGNILINTAPEKGTEIKIKIPLI